MTRRCSHCTQNGHNSRTCPNRGVKLFGVRLTDGPIRKSASMGNLTHYSFVNAGHQNGSLGDNQDHQPDGYASEDVVTGSSCSRDKKKGVPWTEEEHRMFLFGLQKLGKGDWRGISHNYVVSRTPTQVASHAQKYFIRQSKVTRRKRRSSLFDIAMDEFVDTAGSSKDRDLFPLNQEAKNNTPPPAVIEEQCESMESANPAYTDAMLRQSEGSQYTFPILYPAYVAPIFPYPSPVAFWPGFSVPKPEQESRDRLEKEELRPVMKPTAVHAKTPINVNELVGMSKLSLGESIADCSPSPLSLKLVDGSTRPSAFHASSDHGSSSRYNPVHAV